MFKSVAQWLLMLLAKALVKVMPDRMKRLLALVSLYNYILEKRDTPDHIRQLRLAELNDALGLATTGPRGLAIGLLFSKIIWSKNIDSTELDERHREQIIKNMPPWIRYGRNADINADLRAIDRFFISHKNA